MCGLIKVRRPLRISYSLAQDLGASGLALETRRARAAEGTPQLFSEYYISEP